MPLARVLDGEVQKRRMLVRKDQKNVMRFDRQRKWRGEIRRSNEAKSSLQEGENFAEVQRNVKERRGDGCKARCARLALDHRGAVYDSVKVKDCRVLERSAGVAERKR